MGAVIPRILHQVDLGEWGERQRSLSARARRVNRGWDHRLWTPENCGPLVTGDLLGELLRRHLLTEAANVIKFEVLAREGGVAFSQQLLAIRPFDELISGAAVMMVEGYARHLADLFVASAPAHPLIHELLRQLPLSVASLLRTGPLEGCTGWRFLSEFVQQPRVRDRISIVPSACLLGRREHFQESAGLSADELPGFVFAIVPTESDLAQIALGDLPAEARESTPSDPAASIADGRPEPPARSPSHDASPPAPATDAIAELGPVRPAIVVVEHNGIGDVVVAASTAAALRRDWPQRRIYLAVRDHLRGWAELFADADGVCSTSETLEGAQRIVPTSSYQRNEIPEHGRRTRHAYYAATAEAEPAWPWIRLAAEDVEWARTAWGVAERTVVVSPFTAFAIRSWPPNYFGDVIQGLRRWGASVIVLDGPGDGARSSTFGTVHYWGLAPGRAAALIQRCDFFLGNDSGLAHLAGALGTRGVVVCGPTAGKSVFGFYQSLITVQASLPCSPCYWHQARGYRVACDLGCEALFQLSPGVVLRECLKCLGATKAHRAEELVDAPRGPHAVNGTVSIGEQPSSSR
jgi:hypothetical protein